MTTAELFDTQPPTPAAPVVIGLDLSLTATGYAGPDGTKVIKSTGHKDDTLAQRADRLAGLCEHIFGALDGWQADLVVIEAPSIGQARGSSGNVHDRSGLWWLIVGRLFETRTPVVEVPPGSLKKYVSGNGSLKKNAISMHVLKRFGVEIEDDNEADAFVLRAIGLDLLGHALVQLPVVHRAALEKLPRPAVRGGA
jgi:crossover junction endodeoxyribonuclease RuvC